MYSGAISLLSVTKTFITASPLISIPRIPEATSLAKSGSSALFIPPAFPLPPPTPELLSLPVYRSLRQSLWLHQAWRQLLPQEPESCICRISAWFDIRVSSSELTGVRNVHGPPSTVHSPRRKQILLWTVDYERFSLQIRFGSR